MSQPTVETILWGLALAIITAVASWALSRASAVADMQRTLERQVAAMIDPVARSTTSLERLHALERALPMLEERLAGYVANHATWRTGHETWCDGRHAETAHALSRHESEIAVLRERHHALGNKVNVIAGRGVIEHGET